MHARRAGLTFLIVASFSLSTAALLAQKGKPAPKADIPGESALRCAENDVLCGDAIGGQSYVDGVYGVQSEITALNGGEEQFRLRLISDSGTPRYFTLRFPSEALESAGFECENDLTYGCFAAIPEGGIIEARPIPNVGHAGMATAGAAGLLTGLGVGSSTTTTFIIGFPDPDSSKGYRWALYWDPSMYPNTDLVTVTRTASCTWVIAAGENAIAGLILFNVPKTKKGGNKTLESYEGRFSMPFEITFTTNIPGC